MSHDDSDMARGYDRLPNMPPDHPPLPSQPVARMKGDPHAGITVNEGLSAWAILDENEVESEERPAARTVHVNARFLGPRRNRSVESVAVESNDSTDDLSHKVTL